MSHTAIPLILLLIGCNLARANGSSIVCAIRWDAWYTNGPSDPGYFTAQALSPTRWHALAPLNAQFDSSGKITWQSSQEILDAEIRAGSRANLCWTYVMYGKGNKIDIDDPMMKALALHRSSSIRSSVKYAMMTTTSEIGVANRFDESVAATVALLSDSNYQHVVIEGSSRPLIFILYNPADLANAFKGQLPKMKESIDAIRRASVIHKLGNPYIVVVFGPPSAAEAIRNALGGDAISEYIAGNRKGGPERWADFEPSIEADWDRYAEAGKADSVPTLRSGADIRARCQVPPPFDRRFISKNCDTYTENPTTNELGAEFRDAVKWVGKNRSRDPSGLLLVYAWSECDESGNCLMPTYGDPKGQKIDVIAEAVR